MSKRKYTDEELIENIQNYIEEHGEVPTQTDIEGWPGPSPTTYKNKFGSWENALEAAGMTPRGE